MANSENTIYQPIVGRTLLGDEVEISVLKHSGLVCLHADKLDLIMAPRHAGELAAALLAAALDCREDLR